MGQSGLKRQSTFSEPSRFDLASYLNRCKIFGMARKVFFSFHYQRDLWRVNVVRNSGVVEGVSAAGFHDQSLWEETKRKGDDAIKKLIDSGLDGTVVTVVLIGAETASRKLCHTRSRKASHVEMGYWGYGSTISKIKMAALTAPGPVPAAMATSGAPVYA